MLQARYAVSVLQHIVAEPDASAVPERDKLTAYSQLDAQRLAQQYGLPFTAKGIVITNVASDSPADRMGLMAGDIILNLNGTDIRDVSTFKRIASGDVQGWQITLQRQGQLIRTYIDG